MPRRPIAAVIAIQLNSAMPTAEDGGLVVLPEAEPELAGLVALAAALEAVLLLVVFASGPVKKKFPARGLPKLNCSAKADMLKLLIGVDALRMPGTAVLKFAGWAKSNSMYLRRRGDHVSWSVRNIHVPHHERASIDVPVGIRTCGRRGAQKVRDGGAVVNEEGASCKRSVQRDVRRE